MGDETRIHAASRAGNGKFVKLVLSTNHEIEHKFHIVRVNFQPCMNLLPHHAADAWLFVVLTIATLTAFVHSTRM
jgi:hypothetical protein